MNASVKWWKYLYDIFIAEVFSYEGSGLCLDVGCGSGHYLKRIVEQQNYEGFGIDPLPLKTFQKSEKMHLVRGVGEYLPIKNGCVQLCIMTGTLDHVKSPLQTIKEIHRALTSKGRFMLLQSVTAGKKLSKHETHLHQFSIDDLNNLLQDFTIEKISRFSYFPILHLFCKWFFAYKILSKIYAIIGYRVKDSAIIIQTNKT